MISTKYEDTLDFRLLGEDNPIGSTQDETKRLLGERDAADSKFLAVLAQKQDNGRGTQGRIWEGKVGNVYLTVAVPMDKIPATITLLPLQIGVLIAQGLRQYSSKVAVKWPNDVLIGDQKIAGVLIENWMSPTNHECWFVIGIGINVAYAPQLPEGVRPAVCLLDICNDDTPSATEIGTKLVNSFLDWLDASGPKQIVDDKILNEWKSLVQFGQLYKIRETGEEVTTLDIQADGQLKVRGANGQERLLTADYLH